MAEQQKATVFLINRQYPKPTTECNKSRKNSAPQKQSRKCEDPVRFTPTTQSSKNGNSTWICENPACKAILSINDKFCRRCCCSICHRFDANKDPSLWLVCESESSSEDSCGLSCHVECAFKHNKVGVVNLGQHMQLDGNYWCVSCGKVSEILGCWKKQLAIAKDASRMDLLCYRVFLSYSLLNGTSRFKELHQIITEAKIKLEAEVGPMSAESVKNAGGIVGNLAVVSDVQKLCSVAIDKAEKYPLKIPKLFPNGTVDSIPAAGRFQFEEVTSSSLAIVVIEIPTPLTDEIKGYRLWCSKTGEETSSEDPSSIFPKNKTRVYVKNLQPLTEYTFRIIPYTATRDLGYSEAKCFTKNGPNIHNDNPPPTDPVGPSSGLKVRDSGKKPNFAWAKSPSHLEGFCSANIEKCCSVTKSQKDKKSTPVIRELDLNVVSMPDLNEDFTPPLEDNGPDDDVASKIGPSNCSRAQAPTQSRDFDSSRQKRGSSAVDETHDSNMTPINGSPFRVSIGSRTGSGIGPGPESKEGSLEFCVKIIRGLECQGYLNREFRLKLLTWFCLNSSDQERRVVNTFIETLKDDPKSLAGQLVDSFADIISRKRARNSYTSKLTPIPSYPHLL